MRCSLFTEKRMAGVLKKQEAGQSKADTLAQVQDWWRNLTSQCTAGAQEPKPG